MNRSLRLQLHSGPCRNHSLRLQHQSTSSMDLPCPTLVSPAGNNLGRSVRCIFKGISERFADSIFPINRLDLVVGRMRSKRKMMKLEKFDIFVLNPVAELEGFASVDLNSPGMLRSSVRIRKEVKEVRVFFTDLDVTDSPSEEEDANPGNGSEKRKRVTFVKEREEAAMTRSTLEWGGLLGAAGRVL